MKENMNNLWAGWQKMNDNMVELWNKSVSSFQPKTAQMEKENGNLLSNLSEEIIKQQESTQEFYKKLFEVYAEWAKNYSPEKLTEMFPKNLSEGTEKFKELFNTEKYMDLFKQMTTFDKIPNIFPLSDSKDIVAKISKQWYDSMQILTQFIPNSSIRESFDKAMNSYNLYSNLYNFWSDIVGTMPSKQNSEAWDTFMKSVMDNYKKLSSNFAQSFLPEELRAFITNPIEDMPVYQQTLLNFFRPWVEDSGDLQKNLMLALKGDKVAYTNFLKEWGELYKNSYSKILNMPMVGSNRVMIEKALKNLDAFIQYFINLNEFATILNNLSIESMEKLVSQLGELSSENKVPESFMEFFKLWSNTNEKAFEELFATESFSKLMNDTVNAGYKFKIGLDDLIQDQLSLLPIPNRREINSVEKTVYELRKKIKTQSKQIEELRDKFEAFSSKGGASK
ncbi:poly(R)-hydroxyalkanoic acid synthase subunit [Clostridium homopropionicum DSM 5847]|uniref:Poly(3-hydroxyalkanoate) polymerase subunit PhaE n=1 Tax=Clostridium homopropionicum DSM 5847 TaxID=1121318 RepID=A0A0L6Z598_9CLOT|nr:poly(R)-hydroxyalkanoic acid synthase subunit PhaE [Clostridium homopropionicum]KOA18135.1 poly(R)-hydroxyalkanoic acid synthase subunit [Clostridium homopropionicum DSM 5847]SFG96537.1 poly(R)-hydroxyalkanoic acid synthase, class III, PhaE subunit [Clostridium homopropionicum]